MIVAGTGHRPNKLGGYGKEPFEKLCSFAQASLVRSNVTKTISGMALGWDLALAVASIELGIPVLAAVPFEGFQSRWPAATQHYWEYTLLACADVHIVCPDVNTDSSRFEIVKALDIRNHWMVDNCEKLAALWNGTSGGTANCIRYANKKRRPVDNHWYYWERSKLYCPEIKE